MDRIENLQKELEENAITHKNNNAYLREIQFWKSEVDRVNRDLNRSRTINEKNLCKTGLLSPAKFSNENMSPQSYSRSDGKRFSSGKKYGSNLNSLMRSTNETSK